MYTSESKVANVVIFENKPFPSNTGDEIMKYVTKNLS